jgi:Putative adhesin
MNYRGACIGRTRIGLTWAAMMLLGAVSARGAWSQSAAPQRVDRKIPFDPDGSFRIYNMTGSVRVETWDKDTVAVSGTISNQGGAHLFFGGTTRGGKMGIESSNDLDQPPAHLVVRVPAKARVWIKSATASVTLIGIRGGADVFSTSGDIRFEGDPDQLNLETMDGDIDVNARGVWVRAKTASGTITLRGTGEDVAATTVSGAISLLSSGMRRARAESVSGDIGFAGTLARDGVLEVESHSGKVDILLPSDLNAEFDISTYHGSIQNTFDPARVPRQQASGLELHFNAGQGGARVDIKTFKGTILLRKK